MTTLYFLQTRSMSRVEGFPTVQAAITRGMTYKTPFDVSNGRGAIVWPWEWREYWDGATDSEVDCLIHDFWEHAAMALPSMRMTALLDFAHALRVDEVCDSTDEYLAMLWQELRNLQKPR